VHIVRELFLKEQHVSLESCAILLMWNRPFSNFNELIDAFKIEIGAPEFLDTCFSTSRSIDLNCNSRPKYLDLQNLLGMNGITNTLDFDNITLTSMGSTDLYVAKYNSNGEVEFAFSEGGDGFEDYKIIKAV
jgi:hypothetical protein